MAYQNFGQPFQQPYPSYQANPIQPNYGYPSAPSFGGMPYQSAPQHASSSYSQDPFRQWYRHQLSTLTNNSRIIIQNLSLAAMERRDKNDWGGMTTVGEEIAGAIERAPPHAKLPLMYLLDSISKNVGAPYTTHVFPPFLAGMFLQVYRQVDGVTKTDMEKMLRTWRQGGVGGVELFGPEVRMNIESGIYGRETASMMSGNIGYGDYHVPTPPTSNQSLAPNAYDAERQRVTQSLTNALQSKRTALQYNPADAEARVHVGVLEQIERLLASGVVKPHEIREIQAQLDTIQASNAPPAKPVSSIPARQQPYASGSASLVPPHNQYRAMGSSTPTGFERGHSRNGSTPISALPPSLTTAAPPKMNFGNLLRDLASAGVIGSNASTPHSSTPVLGKATMREGSVDSLNSAGDFVTGIPKDEPEEDDGLKEYEELILSMNVSLTLADLNKAYDFQPTVHLPNKCSQCAARFPAGKTGKDRLQFHLDWHFRRNRKERESEGRGANRRWLPRADFWIKDVAANVVSADGASVSAVKANANSALKVDPVTIAKRREELSNAWIPVPSDPSKAALPCPICKEKFISEYNEDEEEWIWKNAIQVEGQIFHSTCRADAVTSTVATRKLGINSRATTPQGRHTTPLPAPSPLGKAITKSSATQKTTIPGMSPASSPLALIDSELDVKPSLASLEASDRADPSVPFMREDSAGSVRSGTKRKAEDEIDIGKEVKKEKP